MEQEQRKKPPDLFEITSQILNKLEGFGVVFAACVCGLKKKPNRIERL